MSTPSERRAALGRRGTPTRSRFTYHKRSVEDLTTLSQKYAQGGRDNYIDASIQTYTPTKGDNWIRILPPSWDGANHYGIPTYVHYGIGPDRQAYLCANKNKGELCPICDERTELARQGQDDAANELRPTYRVAVYIINRKEPDKGVLAWTMPYRIDQELVTLSQDKHTGEVLWIDDPDNGYDVEFLRTGEGLHTQYTGIRISRNPTPLGDQKALDFIVEHPLSSIFIYADPEAINKALSGQSKIVEQPSDTPPQAAPPAQSTPVSRPLARRSTAKPASYTPEQLLDAALRAADTYNIDIPDELSDAEVAPYVADALGDKLSEYPELETL